MVKKHRIEPALNDLLEFAKHDKNLHSFVVGCTLIEYFLNQLIELSLKNHEEFDTSRLRFYMKVDYCIAQEYLKKEQGNFIKKLKEYRNKFAHELRYELNYEQCYDLVKEAGKVGFLFTDLVDVKEKYARKYYNKETLIDCLFDVVIQEVAFKAIDIGGQYTLY